MRDRTSPWAIAMLLAVSATPRAFAETASRIAPVLRRAAMLERRALPLRTAAVGERADPRTALRRDADGRVEVQLHLDCAMSPALRGELAALDVAVEHASSRRPLARARVPLARLKGLAANRCVARIGPPSYAVTRTGPTTTAGDTILRAMAVRDAGGGLDGAGVRVGVVSLGVRGLATAQAAGELPAVSVLDAGCTSTANVGCAEGTAMLEIVHDLAPAAALGFVGPFDALSFCADVGRLQSEFAADVIVDDLGFFREPYFEDGLVADCARDAADAGVLVVSAAGNDGDRHYQGEYVDALDGRGSHRIGPGNAAFDVFGTGVRVFVQWSEPFGGASSDYDLCLATETPGQCAGFNTQQDGDDDPLEDDAFNCAGGCSLQVRRISGAARTLELFVVNGSLAASDRVIGDGVFGHAAVAEVVAVASIAAATPGHEVVQPYSSRGDATILHPITEVRAKPDVAGIDGVAVSGAAGFPTPFFGTSAAAPHVAAVAALLLQANAGLPAADVRSLLMAGAVDLSPAGRDPAAGAGRVDAFATTSAGTCGATPPGLDGRCAVALRPGMQPLFVAAGGPSPSAFDLLATLDATGAGVSEVAAISNGGAIAVATAGFGGDDFPLAAGQGVLASITLPTVLPLPLPTSCPAAELGAGVNLLGLPCVPLGYRAFRLLADLGTAELVTAVQRVDPPTGRFETAVYDGGAPGGSDFPIRAGEAYLVHLTAARPGFDPVR